MFIRVIVSADRSRPRTGAEELAAGSDLAAGRKDAAGVDFVGREEAETKAGPMIEMSRDALASTLGEVPQFGTFRQILPQQSVGVFVGAALPGVVWSGEV